MKVVWSRHPISAKEIIEALPKDEGHPKTFKTLLNRLVKKRALRFQKNGRAYLYTPRVPRCRCALKNLRRKKALFRTRQTKATKDEGIKQEDAEIAESRSRAFSSFGSVHQFLPR